MANTSPRPGKAFLILGFVGLGVFAFGLFMLFCIGLFGLLLYGRMYFYDGYDFTAVLTTTGLVSIVFGMMTSIVSFITAAIIRAASRP